MKIIIEENYDSLSDRVADLVIERVKEKPNLTVGLITGSTPIGLYKRLVDSQPDFSGVTSFNVDEYLGLPKNSPQSYYHFMHENLFDHLDFNQNFIPESEGDPLQSCRDYEKKIKDFKGIDLQLLGVGRNGHIAFNEPGTSFDSRTHVANLSEKTIEANSRFFKSREDVPKRAITVGLGTLMEAREIIVLVAGEKKADICRKVIKGPVTTDVPASVLQRHGNVTIILDKDAAKLI